MNLILFFVSIDYLLRVADDGKVWVMGDDDDLALFLYPPLGK